MQISVERRPTIVFLVTLAILFVVMAANRKTREGGQASSLLERSFMTAFSPIPRLVNATWQGMSDIYYGYVDLRGTVEDNRALRRRVDELTRENIRYRSQSADLTRMRRMLNYSARNEFTSALAGIVMLDTSGPFRSMILDQGEDEQVAINDTVVNPDGLIGRVVLVSEQLSKVQLVTDQKSAVGCRIERTRRLGVLRGDGQGGLDLGNVPALADVVPGDRIVTAGIDGIYPPGIPVATVVEVSEGGDLFTRVKCEPTVNFAELDDVLILHTTKIPDPVRSYQP